MGPGHFCPGFEAAHARYLKDAWASMGPGHFCPGFAKGDKYPGPDALELQWGPGISARDSQKEGAISYAKVVASMGPGHFCPGFWNDRAHRKRGAVASMGPGHFCPGFFDLLIEVEMRDGPLQWGPGISARDSPMEY